jgi:hypothetical protein
MKIQLASDLRLEYLQRDFPAEYLIAPTYGADVLVLAGDIANGPQAIARFEDWPAPVLYLAGNHEFFHVALRVWNCPMYLSWQIAYLEIVRVGIPAFTNTLGVPKYQSRVQRILKIPIYP